MKNRWNRGLRQLVIAVVVLALSCLSVIPALADEIEISPELAEQTNGEALGGGLTIDMATEDNLDTPDLADTGLSIDLAVEPVSSAPSPATDAEKGNPEANGTAGYDTPLKDCYDKAQFEAWLEAEKKKAESADHILGPGGDVIENDYTLVLPGETIAIVPVDAGVTDVDVQTGLMRFGFTIYQMDDPVVLTEYTGYNTINLLPRTGTPSRTNLTEVETATLPVPYRAREGIEEIVEGSITDYTYVSKYVNNTGLPIVIQGQGGAFNQCDSPGKMLGKGGSNTEHSFQGGGSIYSKPNVWFLEKYYIVDFDTEKYQQYFPDAGPLVCSDGTTSWKKAKSPFPFKLYVDAKDRTYEIPNPLMKGFAFDTWQSERPYRWFWGDMPSRTHTRYTNKSANFRAEFAAEKIAIQLNLRDFVKANLSNGSIDLCCFTDVLLWPTFYAPRIYMSPDTLTLGFNPNGGKIKGMDYYLCEATGFKDKDREMVVDIGKLKPVREDYRFKGWCTDPKDPKGTLIKDTSPENSDAWRQHAHTELYAVWEYKNRISIKTATVSAIKAQTYTGKTIKPDPVVKYNGKKLVKGTDYTVSYKNNKAIGKATVTITGKDKFKDSVKVAFKINPKAVSLASLTPGKGNLTVKWKKTVGGAGYQIQYSTKSSFKSAKTVTIARNATVEKVLKGLTAGQTYYVRIRGYKKVNGTAFVSKWSKALSKKVK